MELTSTSIVNDTPIPGDFAFCLPDPAHHVCLGRNRNPHLAWHDLPRETSSLALICHDPDVPSRGDDVNQLGRTVPASLPRVDFFHWVLVDIPPTLSQIGEAEFSQGITPRGKTGPTTLHGARHGLNDYTGWFAGDADMRGDYFGYDGPCPPWNDELPHRYVFTLFALDIAKLDVSGHFTGQQARDAMRGYILAQASLTVRYTLNPAVAL